MVQERSSYTLAGLGTLAAAFAFCGKTESSKYWAIGGHSLRIRKASTVPMVRDEVLHINLPSWQIPRRQYRLTLP